MRLQHHATISRLTLESLEPPVRIALARWQITSHFTLTGQASGAILRDYFLGNVTSWIPFSRQINSVFESSPRLAVKLAAGAAFGLILGVSLSLKWAVENSETTPVVVYVALVGGCVVLSTGLVVVHCLKDSVRRRMAHGQSVNSLLRLLLASGYVSLVVWVLLAFAAASALVAILP